MGLLRQRPPRDDTREIASGGKERRHRNDMGEAGIASLQEFLVAALLAMTCGRRGQVTTGLATLLDCSQQRVC